MPMEMVGGLTWPTRRQKHLCCGRRSRCPPHPGQSRRRDNVGGIDRPQPRQSGIYLRRSGGQCLVLRHLSADAQRRGLTALARRGKNRVAVEMLFQARGDLIQRLLDGEAVVNAAALDAEDFLDIERERRRRRTGHANRCRTPCRPQRPHRPRPPSINTGARWQSGPLVRPRWIS